MHGHNSSLPVAIKHGVLLMFASINMPELLVARDPQNSMAALHGMCCKRVQIQFGCCAKRELFEEAGLGGQAECLMQTS